MGPVEQGVRKTLADYGIKEPQTAVECLAVRLGNTLDNLRFTKDEAPIAQQLRLTLDECKEQPHARSPVTDDEISQLINRQ